MLYMGDTSFMAGVYAISGRNNDGLYIGASTHLDLRPYQHFHALRTQQHYCPKLQEAWNYYGEQNFVFLILEPVGNAYNLPDREQEWMNRYAQDCEHELYNASLIVPKRRVFTHSLSEETRKKISKAMMGKNRGKKRSIEQTRAKFYRFLSPNGQIVECRGLREHCEQYGTNPSHLSKVARGKLRQHKGWRLPPLN
jgi:group I intron endonuclease